MLGTRLRALVLLALLAPVAPAAGDAPPTDAERVARAMAFLASTQDAVDGTFALPNQAYALEAAANAGLAPKAWPTRERSAHAAQRIVDPDECVGASDPKDCAYYALLRLTHAMGTAGYDPRAFQDVDLVERVRAGFLAVQFGNVTYVNDDVWAILALRAAGVPANDAQIQAAAENVRRAQLPDGGWSFTRTSTLSTTDVTGAALASLRAAGDDTTRNADARAFLLSMQDGATGGFRGSRLQSANCASTVWGIHGLRLVGAPEPARALDHLRALQDPASGGIAQSTYGPDPFCTVEAVVVLAGARYPLPSYAPGKVSAPPIELGAPATLAVQGPFTWASWSVGGANLTGTRAEWSPPAAGAYPFEVVAEGTGTRFRHEGVLRVASPPPTLVLTATEADAYRRHAITIDATASTDADGHVADVEVDWGDGTVTRAPLAPVSNAYATAGERRARVRVMDDAGVWSAPGEVIIRVHNRAPELTLPPRMVADRASDVRIAPLANDPDEDAVTVTWTVDGATGEGPFTKRFATLGEREVVFRAMDPGGAATSGAVVVDVVNLPPRVEIVRLPDEARPGEAFRVEARASDPDGPPPRITWRAGNATLEGQAGDLALDEGAHVVTVEAADADGGTARETRTLLVRPLATDAPPSAPRIASLRASLEGGRLVVEVDASPEATLKLSWSSDAGEGEMALPGSGAHEVPLANATRASVRILATRGDLEASRETSVTQAVPAAGDVAPLPPPVFDAPPATARRGLAARFALVPMEDALEYRFEWGDGAATEWSNATLGTHAFFALGGYDVEAHARAADGRTSRATTRIVIEDAPRVAAAPAPPPEFPPAEPAAVRVEATSLTPEAAPSRQEAPAPAALVLLGLLIGGLGTRARRGPRSPRR